MTRRMTVQHPLLEQAIAMSRAGRKSESVALIEQAAAAGVSQALFWLAEIYWVGGPRLQDCPRGRLLFQRASDAGHPAARINYTNLLANGIAGPRDWAAALRRLDGEARLDPERAQVKALLEQMDLTPDGDPRHVPGGEVLSHAPHVTVFRAAFTPAECGYLMAGPNRKFRAARVEDGTRRGRVTPVRTSEESSIHALLEDPAVHAINRRLAALTGTGVDQGESLQILRYRIGQEFRPHVDWMDEENRRVLTALIYLNEDYAGGETLFVQSGLRVKGRTGDALVFRTQSEDGRGDPRAEHAGLPVSQGIKFIASRWIHERRWVP
jgi:prolyl 4-hydroxylase